MSGIWQDARYGWRRLRLSPGFTLVAALTLGLGIGANTAVFSLVYDVLLRPLAYPHSDRLVTPAWTTFASANDVQTNVNQPTYLFWRDHSRVFESIAAYTAGQLNLSASGMEASRAAIGYVSSNYFHTLGIEPAVGRDFLPAEDSGSGAPVAILSRSFWASHFAADPNALGKTLALDGVPYTVIGVLPESFAPLETSPDLYIPLARAPGPLRGGANLTVVARLDPGLSIEQAQAGMQRVAEQFKAQYPQNYPPHWGIALIPLKRFLNLGSRSYLLLLVGAVGLVLLIACANVAGLLVARSAGRSGEIALRLAFGASRGRLVRQLFTESLLLALVGAAASLPLAYGGLELLLRVAPWAAASNPVLAQALGAIQTQASTIGIDRWSLAFALGAGIVTAILFGLLPAWQAARANVSHALQEGGSRSTAASSRARLRGGLVIGEIAVTMVLLSGALLLARTLVNLMRVGPGFETSHLLAVNLPLGGQRYRSGPALTDFYRSLTGRVDALPGVRGAAMVAAGIPLETGGNMPMAIETVPNGQSVDFRTVSDSYFRTLGVPLVAGRTFTSTDTASSTPVAVVTRQFARRYFGNRSPLGLHVTIGASLGPPYQDPPREIVGIVGDVKSQLELPAEPTVYVPVAQANVVTVGLFGQWFPTELLVRTSGDPLRAAQPIRKIVDSLDGSLPVGKIRTMDQIRGAAAGLQQFLLTLMGIFAGLALLLAAVGLYGVLSYTVAQRTAEIGLRMALGATPGDVLGMLLRHAGWLVGLGIAAGAAAAYGATRVLSSLLFGVRASDPATLAATAALLGAVALLAATAPAWRAMRVAPATALRHE